jgi:trigger factor
MADTPTTEESQNTITVEELGPCLKKLTIEIPSEVVDEKLGESIDTLSIEAQLPGFRKGRVPRRLIERKFGSDVRNEAKNQLIASAYTEAVERHELKVIGDPSGDSVAELEVEPGKPLKFDVEVEVQPEFEIPSLDGIDVKKPIIDVPDAAIDAELERICVNEGRLEERETPEAGDYLTGTGVMTGDEDGHEFYNIPGAVIRIPLPEDEGKGMILGIMVEDFSDQVGMPKPGETVTVKAVGPDNHEVEKLRGSKVTVTFEVERVDRIIAAEIDDIVSRFGMADAEQLKSAIRSRMEQRAVVQQQTVMRQQISRYLIENTKIELPERVTAQQAARTLERRRLELMHRGVDPQEIETHMAELRAASGEVAVRELKLFFILHSAADDLDVKVEEAEINGRIAHMAGERNVRPERLRQELIQNNQISGIYTQIREHKTMDVILDKAKIEEMSGDDFNALMKEQSEAS